MFKKQFLGVVFLIVLTLPINSYAINNSVDNYYLESLKTYNKKAPVLIPKYIPKGFTVKSLDIHLSKEKGIGEGDNYSIKYTNSNLVEFSIISANGGFGGLGYSGSINFKSKFGNITMYIEPIEFTPDGGKQKLDNEIFTEWFTYKNQFFMFSTKGSYNSKRLSKDESIKIINSLSTL